MRPAPLGDPGRDSPDRRAAKFGLGGIATGIAAIVAAGGKAGSNDATIRFAIAVFGLVATVTLFLRAIFVWVDRPNSPSRVGKPDPQETQDGEESSPAELETIPQEGSDFGGRHDPGIAVLGSNDEVA